ncbi:hypothetical protein [Clostridium sp. JS66]|uniref:hypothetical protein n=1 Tax=Clostridium sp. JS66 TaxID=3064705 RepID=UPI00298DA29C|nr:hypothetical protein [Clostridium sp. JS66]WPC39240.1 hypothetical protein Q6H37_15090 [Clostridium sp. JS66]
MKNNTWKKALGLILFSIAAILFFVFAPSSQGELDFNVKMDKNQAINETKKLAEKHGWSLKNSRETASFSLDEKAQTYYELKVGNFQKLNSLINKEEGYIPATWTVSIIPKGGNEKVDVYFTPSGKVYGFYKNVLDDVKGPALSEDAAKTIAEKESVNNWSLNLKEYKLVDKSQKIQSNGRIDYIFNYIRYMNIGEAKDKVELQVKGDKLVKVQHYLDVPESFTRNYEQQRSSNDNIANTSSFIFYILIFIVGFFCFFYLNKRKMIAWKNPLIFVVFLIFMTLINGIFNMKQDLTYMDTTYLTPTLFYIVKIFISLMTGVLTGIFTFISICIGEGLYKKTFPNHLNFWKMLSVRNFGSWQFLNRVIIAYVFVALMLIYETIFYGTMNHLPGWWQPASMITDPNIQGNWFAWVGSFAEALNAGVFEEFAFRAMPICIGVLIGNKYNKRKLCIVIAFVFEILVFSSAHANYPGFPAYARLLELLIVALGFGLMFYFWGIISGIIAHFTYDFILMSMMIMITPGKALMYQKILIPTIVIFPLILAIYGRMKNGCWIDIEESVYNSANIEECVEKSNKNIEETRKEHVLDIEEREADKIESFIETKKKNTIITVITAFLAIFAIISLFTIDSVIPKFAIERLQAESLAKQEIEKEGFKLSNDWKVISNVQVKDIFENDNGVFVSQDFIRKEGKDKYKSLIGNYINPFKWKVRFVKFNGDINERAEEFQVTVIDKKHNINVKHILPQNKKGEKLTKEQAERVLYNFIKNKYAINRTDLKEISAKENKLDNRTDWAFTLEDKTTKLKIYKPEINAVVSGNEVLQINKTLQVSDSNQSQMLKKYAWILIVVIILIIAFAIPIIWIGIKAIIAWSKNQISKPIFFRLFFILLILNIVSLFLNMPEKQMEFSTTSSFESQLITSVAGGMFGKVIVSFIQASIIAYAKNFYKKTLKHNYFNVMAIFCIVLILFSISNIFTGRNVLEVDRSIYCSLGALNKFLGQLTAMCTSYIGKIALFFAILMAVKNLKNRCSKIALGILLIVPYGIASSFSSSSPAMLVFSLLCGVIYILLYKYFFQYNAALSAVFIGIMYILSNVKGIVLNQYPTLNVSVGLSLIITSFLIIYTYNILEKEF